ncbi:MAG: hypothetical protein HY323_03445, partial [Betaproteobacteria bacterium]|nr:hypothetical protein [Betaproteobacteria bacterium]
MTSHSDDWSNVGPPPLTDEEAASMLKVLRETASEEPGPPPIGSKDKDLDDVGRSVIGAILAAGALGEALPPEVRLVEAEYFGEPSLAKIWWAIEAMWEREEPIDEVTVGSWLAINDEPKLVLLAVQLAGDCPSTMNLDHWARLLCEAGRKRQLSHKLGELSLRAGNGASFADVSAAIQDSLRGVEDMTRGGGLEHVSLPLKRVLAEIEAGTEDEPIAKTGLPALDVLTKLRAG